MAATAAFDQPGTSCPTALLTICLTQGMNVEVPTFDGAGGIRGSQMVRFEVSGFEVEGPGARMTYGEAIADRLLHSPYFSGRGIAVWGGSYIKIHDITVSNCPNSGIRVNRGDYLMVDNNLGAACPAARLCARARPSTIRARHARAAAMPTEVPHAQARSVQQHALVLKCGERNGVC